MRQELEYRTFQDLLDSVKTDFRTFALEGVVEDQELIKVALRLNAELGLKVNPNRQVLLQVDKGKTRLPADFRNLNFAVLFGDKKLEINEYDVLEGMKKQIGQKLRSLESLYNFVSQEFVRSFRTTLTLSHGTNLIKHNLNTTGVLVQIRHQENLLGLEYEPINENEIKLNSHVAGLLVEVIVFGGVHVKSGDPYVEHSCTTKLESEGGHLVCNHVTPGFVTRYSSPIRVDIIGKPGVDTRYTRAYQDAYVAWLDQGHLITSFDHGDLYVNYQGALEDDEGNLLVPDHPYFNEYYEYAFKQRILENLIMNGENEAHKLQLIELRLRVARNQALSYKNTPDFAEMHKVWQANRRAHYHKYYNMIMTNPIR